jgi:hypothetical protein
MLIGEEVANAGIEESAFGVGSQQLLINRNRNVTVAINLAGSELDPELGRGIGDCG